MWAYRHWEGRFADMARTEGRIRISAANFYRDIEQTTLQDNMELRAIGRIEGPVDITAQSPRSVLNGLLDLGIAIGQDNTKRIQQGGSIHFVLEAKPCYVFCMSLDRTVGKFDTPGFPPKDKVTFIPDVKELAEVLVRAAGPDLLPKYDYGEVKYKDRTYRIGEDRAFPDPFSKPLSFNTDAEVRIVLWPNGPIQDHLDIQSAEIAALFSVLELAG